MEGDGGEGEGGEVTKRKEETLSTAGDNVDVFEVLLYEVQS